MKGLTYFKLKSPYPGDITKNCSLDGTEIDGNFFELEGRDIKTAYWQNEILIIERMNGDIISVPGITEGCTKNLSIRYDKENGTLYVTKDGFTESITGFISSDVLTTINSDDTLQGMGTRKLPIGISPMFQTGQYRPAIKIIDTTIGEKLPDPNRVDPRNRFVTIENVSDYGYLYDYNGVRKIACDLRDASSEWRIPTKEDWDDMLNSVEPNLEDRNHDKVTCNRYLGRFAGKLLKSVNLWRLENSNPCDSNGGCSCGNDCNNSNGCGTRYSNNCDGYCGDYTENTCPKPNPYPNRGIDKYGFAAVPAGYGDDGGRLEYFGERGWYWTATNQCETNAYTKRFEYDKSSVYQEVIGTSNALSLRLIKDYDGTNYKERESIIGSDYSSVLMPSLKHGKTIWTSTNVAFSNRYYNPIVPNNGMNLTYTKKFFINEWDGKRWFKNEMYNGDSIVILKAPTGEDNVEYRVINGALSNVATSIYDEVIIAIMPKLDSLKGAIASETIRAKEAERALDSKIDSETARAVHVENNILDQLTQEIERAKQAEEDLSGRIDTISTGHTEDIQKLNEKIDNEIIRATEKENVLEQKIEDEIVRSEAVDTKLTNDLADEIIRAKEAEMTNAEDIRRESDRAILIETQLRNDLNNEITRSTNQDIELNGKIETETNRAEAAEDLINKRIDDLSGSHDADLEALTVKVNDEIVRSTAEDVRLDTKISDEIVRSTNQDTLISGKLISKTGSVMNAASGVLTLATEEPINSITVKLDFNFGSI